jgi:hypothetical protein
MQPRPDWQALVPGQQAAPVAPQLSQVLVLPVRLHAKPELHTLFEQQAWPEPPQALQVRLPPSTPAVAEQTSED